MELFSLRGRTALVTGARTGIGKAIALGLAEAGARLVLLGRTPDFGWDSDAVVARVAVDLADPTALEPALAPVLAEHRVDVLVNNAGTIHRAPAADVPLADWRRILAVNLDSVFELSRVVGARMLDGGGGKIVNIASLLSFQGGVTVPAYTASKHAVAGLTKALANEWAPHNVQVNAIAPGYIATDNTADLRADPDREPAIRARIPAGRWGTPADVVGAAVFLSCTASDYVNGHVLVVDGGWMSR
ncbi:SDR family oxidoreductase [Umezawaea tangerina]|uniref:2-deoxy-D-gluconate 3-dehydrogenase n=1 Tax=Umezawaea tangerina TaxID=84725 RepID=A0A2T0TKL9_9PSEU|nr:SDR family oxidoreductase [Umezawaea tangerina]PRY46226.1 2-deoxy-D-gluconate 3-dehydrogenase [Umezawaea tangerina]